jgi:hypothetical protein
LAILKFTSKILAFSELKEKVKIVSNDYLKRMKIS